MTPDTDLISRAAAGDHFAFQALVERHRSMVYRVAYQFAGNHHDAEDIAQEVFIKVYRSLDRFRQDAQLTSWMYRIVMNACIDYRRRHSPAASAPFGEEAEQKMLNTPKNGPVPKTSAYAGKLGEVLETEIASLPPEQRLVFIMRHHQELKFGEIADLARTCRRHCETTTARGRAPPATRLEYRECHRGRRSMSSICDHAESAAVERHFYDEMPPDRRVEMAAHVARCRDCTAALDDLKVIRSALGSRPDVSAPMSGDWSAFMTRLDAAVLREKPGAVRRRTRIPGPSPLEECGSGSLRSVVSRLTRYGSVAHNRHDQRRPSRATSPGAERVGRRTRAIRGHQ